MLHDSEYGFNNKAEGDAASTLRAFFSSQKALSF
jgi:hypothetical protein